jgi:hypothetical protein
LCEYTRTLRSTTVPVVVQNPQANHSYFLPIPAVSAPITCNRIGKTTTCSEAEKPRMSDEDIGSQTRRSRRSRGAHLDPRSPPTLKAGPAVRAPLVPAMPAKGAWPPARRQAAVPDWARRQAAVPAWARRRTRDAIRAWARRRTQCAAKPPSSSHEWTVRSPVVS